MTLLKIHCFSNKHKRVCSYPVGWQILITHGVRQICNMGMSMDVLFATNLSVMQFVKRFMMFYFMGDIPLIYYILNWIRQKWMLMCIPLNKKFVFGTRDWCMILLKMLSVRCWPVSDPVLHP